MADREHVIAVSEAQTFLAQNYDWIVVKPIRVALMLLAALLLTFLVRRAIKRLAGRIASPEAAAGEAQEQGLCEERDKEGVRAGLIRALPSAEHRERGAQRAKTLATVLTSTATIVIWSVTILLILGELKVNLGPMLAGAGVLGVALGFGAQRIVRDVLSGLFIMMEDQYGVGDIVDVGEASGVVEEVTLRITRLRALDGTLWHVPNGEIRRAGNQSQYWARVLLDVPVPYGADIDKASAIIKGAADAVWRDRTQPHVLEEPEVWGVEEFGADALMVRLVVKTHPGAQWAVARQIRAGIKEAFDAASLEIPFPQRTVWLKSAADTPDRLEV